MAAVELTGYKLQRDPVLSDHRFAGERQGERLCYVPFTDGVLACG